ncbi:hypothetical protein [Moorena producens]|uniref:hypothetical protein n=1 Tax=Moorena producens TaxID=1155739 RepID=UPI003C780F21
MGRWGDGEVGRWGGRGIGGWGDGGIGRWGDGEMGGVINPWWAVPTKSMATMVNLSDALPTLHISPTPYSLLPTPYSLLPTPYSLLPITLASSAS